MGSISLTIDGRTVTTEEGGTVLEAARAAGITIPTICDHKDLNPYGACRICVVEIEGVRGFPTSCTTPAANGMQVTTQSERLTTLRNRTLELMFSGHPNSCLVCVHREACEKYRPKATKAARSTRCGFCANRDECDLRDMALRAGIGDLHLPTMYAAHNLERDDPFMDRDYNLCVLCGRCWRICEKIHGTPAISIINRGKWARLGTAFHKSHVHSGCTFCGSCIDICPTGTLTDRFARWQGKPERETPSACILCPEGCSIIAQAKTGRFMAATMTAFAPEASLCALGRFAYAQLVNADQRLIRPQIRENGEQIPYDWEAAVAAAARGLLDHAGRLAVIVSAASTREERFLYHRLADRLQASCLVLPSDAGHDDPLLAPLKAQIAEGTVRAVLVNGDFLPADALEALAFSVTIDCLPSAASRHGSVLLPTAILSETGGTFRNAAGLVKPLAATSTPPGAVRPEWHILCDLGQAMGDTGFAFADAAAITPLIEDDAPPAAPTAQPRHDVRQLPARFRGHLLADIVPALAAFGLPASPATTDETLIGEGFLLVDKREIVPNMHRLTIAAPQIAAFSRPGQFVILMAKETSERTPFTLADWDAAAGTITLVIEEVGRSSRELVSLQPGARIAHVSGPLGMPFAVERKGTVLLGGGCYGIGAILPLARALRAEGNHVICAIEASSDYLLFLEDELGEASDQLIVATKDGSRGVRGGIQEVLAGLVADGVQLDQFIAIGCTFMMRMATEASRPLAIPTFVALNPIMVDGTGMCGACRVSVDRSTRFACIDGPIFDGHAVDWDELASRRTAYARQEVEALSQAATLVTLPLHAPENGCGRNRG